MKIPHTTQLRVFSNNCMLNVISTTNYNAEAVVVFLHGGPGNGLKSMMEKPAFQQLEDHFGAVYFDQRGCGKSDYDLSKGISLEQTMDDVKCVVNFAKQQFKNKPIYLLGHSFGALLALFFVKSFPDTVEKLVLSAPLLSPSTIDMQKSTLTLLKQAINTIEPQGLVKTLEPILESANTLWSFFNSNEMTSWISMFPKPFPDKDIIWQMYAMRNWLFNNCTVTTVFKDLKIETLCLQGLEDKLCPSQLLLDTIKRANNSKIVVRTFKDGTHSIHKEHQQEYTRITTEFLLG